MLREVHFQDPRDSAQGMSLFRRHVGIASPNETAYADVEVTVDPASAPVVLDGVVQAVSFPIEVKGPMRLRGVSDGDDDDPLSIPEGRYDVLACFVPKKAPKAESAVSLRVFGLRLSFRPSGSLGAPNCLRLEDGSSPPDTIHVNASVTV